MYTMRSIWSPYLLSGQLGRGLLADWIVCYQDSGYFPNMWIYQLDRQTVEVVRNIVACRTIIGILLGFLSVRWGNYGRDRRWTQSSIQLHVWYFDMPSLSKLLKPYAESLFCVNLIGYIQSSSLWHFQLLFECLDAWGLERWSDLFLLMISH